MFVFLSSAVSDKKSLIPYATFKDCNLSGFNYNKSMIFRLF